MTLDQIVSAIKQNPLTHKPVLIGIEGFGGAGKSTVSKKLKDLLGNAYIIQTDDFILKDKLTLVSPDMDCYDLERLRQQVLEPFRRGKEIKYQSLDWESNQLSEPVIVPKIGYLIIEGISAYFPTIAKYYDYKIWVDTPIEIATERGRKKDAGNENEQHWDLWSKNDLAYKEKYHPEDVADFVISNA